MNPTANRVLEKEMVKDKMNKPLVSVIIPAYRCRKTLPEAIDSALIQNVDLEVLVLNDGLPEDLDDIMESYAQDARVRYLQNHENLGASGSRNRGIALAEGEYVAFLDADDRWAPGKLERQMKLLAESGCVLCCTAREMINMDGKSTGRIIPVQERISYKDLLKDNSISCSSAVLPTAVAREFPMEHEDSHEDYIMWLRILRKYGSACGINEPLLQYRISTSGKSGSKLKSAKMTWKVYRYMEFGFLKSIACFVCYAYNGVKKHWL